MRPTNFIGLFTCIFSLIFAYFFVEGYLRLYPCPLCILDRFVLALMGLVFFVGLFTVAFRIRMALTVGNAIFLAFGFLFAGRHVWLQNQPPDPSRQCLVDHPEAISLTEFIEGAFNATADCILIRWEIFGLTIPGMTLILFCLLALLLGIQVLGHYQDRDEDRFD